MPKKPNIVVILCDDMGYSDLGCYGGEIDTPNLNRLASEGVRFTQFYSSPRCAPSRASLLTGLHPHQTGIGILTYDDGPEGYPGNLNKNCVTMAEVLKDSGYRTYLSGKWHLAKDTVNAGDTWPLQRGFDRFFGTLAGSGSFYQPHTLTRDNENIEQEAMQEGFYYTDAITGNAVGFIQDHLRDYPDNPFFQYVAYTAPHWPLHASEEDIVKYKGRFDKGWDRLREERLDRMRDMGILPAAWVLSERDADQPAWDDADHKEWRLRCMEVYAAQIDRMDQGVGQIISTLQEAGQLEDTLILFLSDNGGCAEHIYPHPDPGPALIPKKVSRDGKPVILGNHPDVMPGPEHTYQTYSHWANLSNTPFRLYKSWVHEGGIATPLIMHWPNEIQDKGSLRHTPGQLPDLMATVMEAANASYPLTYKGRDILPLEGRSLVPLVKPDNGLQPEPAQYLFWEHQGNAAVRFGYWKLVKQYPGSWELYDLEKDRTETHDLSASYPGLVQSMGEQYEAWAERCGVIPRETILRIPGRTTHPSPYFGWMI
ncbi:MAG: arylsulfatase [Paenibacillus sp.]|jgi:arylsulfatase|nr:arylsulfatase [Paenibacillus sp.]